MLAEPCGLIGALWGLLDQILSPQLRKSRLVRFGCAEDMLSDLLAYRVGDWYAEIGNLKPVGKPRRVVGMGGLGGGGSIGIQRSRNGQRDAAMNAMPRVTDIAEGDVDAHFRFVGGIRSALKSTRRAMVVDGAELDPVAIGHLRVELVGIILVVGKFLGGHARSVFLRKGVGLVFPGIGIEQEPNLGFGFGFRVAPLEKRDDFLPDGERDFCPGPSHGRSGFQQVDVGRHMADEAVAEVSMLEELFLVLDDGHSWVLRLVLGKRA